MTNVVRLTEPIGSEVVGGKAAAISRLVAAGFAVPSSYAVTVAGYEYFATQPVVARFLADLVRRPLPSPEHYGDAERSIDEAFVSASMLVSLEDEIASAAWALLHEYAGVAVRSSATTEDMQGASFAGQYRSFLDMTTVDDVLRAVRRTWASLWFPSARLYREQHGVAADHPVMGVLLMGQVAAEHAGVAFTLDPGGADAVRVETVTGSGENLVSGRVTPTVELVPRSGRNVDASLLSLDVAEQALSAEALFGSPQDVEWAHDGAQLWLVQSRPITVSTRTLHTDELADSRATRWTTAGIGEMVPGVLDELPWSLNAFMVENGFRNLFDDLGALSPDLATSTGFVGRHGNRVVLNVDLLEQTAGLVPGGSPEDIEREYFGHDTTADDSSTQQRRTGWQRAPTLLHDLRAARVRRRASMEAAITTDAVATITDAHVDLEAMDDERLEAYWHRLVDLGARTAAAEIEVAVAAAAAHRRTESFLSSYIGAQAAKHQTLLLTRTRRSHGVRPEASMAVFAGPTWRESGTPAPVWSNEGVTHVASARERLERELRSTPRWRRARLLTGQIVDVRLHVFRRLVNETVDLLTNRETTKAALLLLGGEVRRVHDELGRRLSTQGVIDVPRDVDRLWSREFVSALKGRPLAIEVVEQRRRHAVAAATETPPRLFSLDGAAADASTRSTVIDLNVVHGWAASPGVYQGLVRVLDTPSSELREGEVLVARTTDASWLPMFLRAGAIVVEEGGPLSHAAIVARELGRPAVVNVPGIVASLRDRSVALEVDGDSGSVRIVEPEPHEAVALNTAASIDSDEIAFGRLAVFVPAVMGAGAVFSLLVWFRDLLYKLVGGRAAAQRVRTFSGFTATATLTGEQQAIASAPRVTTRAASAAGLMFAALAVYVFLGSTLNYLRPGGYVSDIAWLWASSMAVGAALSVLAVASFATVLHSGRAPMWAWGLLSFMPTSDRKYRDRFPMLAAVIAAQRW